MSIGDRRLILGSADTRQIMSDEACGICAVACCDVLAGVCFDFITIRMYADPV